MDNRGFLKFTSPGRTATRARIAASVALVVASLCLAAPATAGRTEAAWTVDEAFSSGLAAGRNDDLGALQQWQARLGNDHPLAAYLDFHQLRLTLDSIPVDTVMDYLRRHADSPLAADMRAMAMDHYGSNQDWSSLRAISQGVPGNLRLRCYYYQAMLANERQRALDEARALWLAGRSRPESCDPLFEALEQAGILDDDLIWQRMLLAFSEDSPGLMRYLRSQLNEDDYARAADRLLQLYRQPREARLLENSGHQRAMIVPALQRLASKDPVYTRKLLPIMNKRFSLNAGETQRVAASVAWYSVIRDEQDNQPWLDQWLENSDSLRLLEQRIRSAIRQQDWPAVAHWIDRLPAAERDSARWHYWMARSLESRQQADKASEHFARAARKRSFWGFLAAERLAEPLPFNQQPVPVTLAPLDQQSLMVTERVALLQRAGEHGLARSEWLWLLRRSDDGQLDALAELAVSRDWPHLAVETALFSGKRDVLDWRFPAAFQTAFEQAAQHNKLDPWLLMALSRRESAFNPGARSSAGARGLMQLMPGTARLVARDLGIELPSAEDLYQPALNIRLGSTYLADLLVRYQGNRILALAAYNAGPHRVDRWLGDADAPLAHDVFIESIPFHETREYVQAVLAYRVLLARHDNADVQLATLSESERGNNAYSRLMLAESSER